MSGRRLFCWLAVGWLASVACQHNAWTATEAAPNTETNYYLVKGEIKELKSDGKTVVIKHEEVPNYMPAMTMPFEVKEPAELKNLRPGDGVSFRLVVTEKDGWIDMVNRLGTTSEVAQKPGETLRRVRLVEPLEIGDRLPDYPFTNELGQAVSLGQFKGQALALTFIFTRCPYPNFCPRMSDNFSQVYEKLSARTNSPTNWHLLSISFDPEFDAPAVLKAYGKRFRQNPARWQFLTGALIEIDALTEQFGLVFPREGINFNHNFRTVVVDAAGRIQHVFIGNEWKVDELVSEMVKAVAAKEPASGSPAGAGEKKP